MRTWPSLYILYTAFEFIESSITIRDSKTGRAWILTSIHMHVGTDIDDPVTARLMSHLTPKNLKANIAPSTVVTVEE